MVTGSSLPVTSGAGVRQQASLGLMALSTQEEVEIGKEYWIDYA